MALSDFVNMEAGSANLLTGTALGHAAITPSLAGVAAVAGLHSLFRRVDEVAGGVIVGRAAPNKAQGAIMGKD